MLEAEADPPVAREPLHVRHPAEHDRRAAVVGIELVRFLGAGRERVSSASALAGETLAAMIGPSAKATSIRTESAESGNGYDLRENAVDGVGVDKGDLQAEEAAARARIDHFNASGGEIGQCCVRTSSTSYATWWTRAPSWR